MDNPILQNQINQPVNFFFPEDHWPPVHQDYGKICSQGREIASKLNVLFLGVVRDADFILKRNLACLDHSRSYFKKSWFFCYENDSKDFSKKILEKYCSNDYNILKTEERGWKRLNDTSLERRKNMAYARNQYLEYAKQEYKTLGVDVVIVLDLDIYGWSYTGMLNSLFYLNKSRESCIGSNSIYYRDNERLFYDTWAYESKEKLSPEEKNRLVFNRGESLHPVNSCFGGMMIYPANVLEYDIKYKSWHCDHVTLHTQLKRLGFDIYLNPSQITLYNKHYYVG